MDDFLEQVARRRRQGAYTVIYFLTWVMIVIGGFSAIMYLTNIIQATETGIHFNFISLILALIFGGAPTIAGWSTITPSPTARWTSLRC